MHFERIFLSHPTWVPRVGENCHYRKGEQRFQCVVREIKQNRGGWNDYYGEYVDMRGKVRVGRIPGHLEK